MTEDGTLWWMDDGIWFAAFVSVGVYLQTCFCSCSLAGHQPLLCAPAPRLACAPCSLAPSSQPCSATHTTQHSLELFPSLCPHSPMAPSRLWTDLPQRP